MTANKKTVFRALLAFLIIMGFLVGLRMRETPQNHTSDNIQVAASFYSLSFFAREIGGARAEVTNITPAGAEPHDYEPTARDMIRIENSRLLIVNGGGFEAWGEDVRENIDPRRTLVVVAGEGLANQRMTENGGDVIDPHVWLNPLLAQQMVGNVTQGFIRVDPRNAAYYEANANILNSRLDDLDRAYREGLRDCARQSIVTSHAAFGYLAAAYGFRQVAITGVSPDAEPSPRTLGEIAAFAQNNNIKYIFFERLVSPKLSETIAREVGARTLVLNPLEGLSAEELAEGKDYITEMQHNLANLQIALQCKK